MKITYKNTGDTTKKFLDGKGRVRTAEPGETITYFDNDSFPSSLDGLISKIDYDANGAINYIGYAMPGTSESQPGWAIKKRVEDGDDEDWILSGGHFVLGYKWTLRATLSYS